jgi:hypothetical protein
MRAEAEAARARRSKRRTVFIVSLVSTVILAVIGTSLVAFSGDSDDGDGGGEPPPGTVAAADAVRYDDPQGAYVVEIDPDWRVLPSSNPEVESWYTGTGNAEFNDNVIIATQEIGDVDLDQYLQLVIDEAPKSVEDFALREFRVVTTEADPDSDEAPTQLGVVAYEGRRGDETFGFFFVASVEDGSAVVATLTSAQDRFDDVRADVEPYLMTLRQS